MSKTTIKDIEPFLDALKAGEVDSFVISWSNPKGTRKTGNSRSIMSGNPIVLARLLGICLESLTNALIKDGNDPMEVQAFLFSMLSKKSEHIKSFYKMTDKDEED